MSCRSSAVFIAEALNVPFGTDLAFSNLRETALLLGMAKGPLPTFITQQFELVQLIVADDSCVKFVTIVIAFLLVQSSFETLDFIIQFFFI